MSYRALAVSIALALVWTGVALWAVRPPAPAPVRYYEIHAGADNYRIQADEVRQDGFCSVFIRAEQRIAAVCGYHTWSETVEVQ
jgi:hypothetical protein